MTRSKTTLWLDADDGPIEVHREDRSVKIEVATADHDWDIRLDPSLFPALRAAMDAAELL